MPGNKKPRKPAPRIKPRGLPTVFRFSAKDERNLQLVPHQSLEAMRRGEGQEPDWHTLAVRLNLGATLAYRLFDTPEARALLDSAQDALRSAWERFEKTQRIGLTGPEMTTIGEALNLTDDMQLRCTRRELSAALAEVFRVAAIRK